ncbi:type II toxin-antitoxin system PemK/MazF family toxin [Pseudoflavonifractor phocaeensis]|uniref:type II toxin-antitoxin system PemK/MazF family toxin n=1 Tax=Pseudoflavonifractor phocaeensis TaxID=1870988 RepID=UPI001957276A|nr:type II toxin-antitoxin system PemK/MazF family toxin [Pseudoflavonifractor phocaeensis]MBM6725384.1 type II toxin-antitoxin system PemK/MazF family toxin [Pseudoflavonifractor phocaeensis]
MKTYHRGDIYYADLRPVVGSEQGGIRPVVILQNNVGNQYSPTVIAAPITTKNKPRIPTHVCLERQVGKLRCGSVILVEQIRTIDKSRLTNRIGALNDLELQKVNQALEISVGLLPGYNAI